MDARTTGGVAVFAAAEQDIGARWLQLLTDSGVLASRLQSANLAGLVRDFVALAAAEARSGTLGPDNPLPDGIREFLDDFSRARASEGFPSHQTATFVFSLKRALFAVLDELYRGDPARLVEETWTLSELVDQWGLHTISVFQQTREDVIRRQQDDMLELSTPVVKLWDGVIALPMIGTLDSARTQVVMETLLQRIVDTEAQIAIIDITGVPLVDTLVAQHLMKTVAAIRLMGADCIISGIRPQIAQTIVHLGVDLGGISTKSTLADALRQALQRSGQSISPASPAA